MFNSSVAVIFLKMYLVIKKTQRDASENYENLLNNKVVV